MTTALTYLDQSHFIHGVSLFHLQIIARCSRAFTRMDPQEIEKEVMLESMELLTQAARSTPNFEADRLREENPRRFTFSD